MKTLRTSLIALATLATLSASNAHASWLSDFTGIDINANKGTVSVQAPNFNATPQLWNGGGVIANAGRDLGLWSARDAQQLDYIHARVMQRFPVYGTAVNTGSQYVRNWSQNQFNQFVAQPFYR